MDKRGGRGDPKGRVTGRLIDADALDPCRGSQVKRRGEEAASPPGLWRSSEPVLISIPEPIRNPGLRERGPNEEMRHRGKVA